MNMKRVRSIGSGAIIIILLCAVMLYLRPLQLGDVSPSVFDNVTHIHVRQLRGMVDDDYVLTGEKQDVVNRYLKLILVRKMFQAFAPKEYDLISGESYVIEIYHSLNTADIIALYPGYVSVNGIVYPTWAPKSFSLLEAILSLS